MEEKEFDEINKKLLRKQRLMLSLFSMMDDTHLPVGERLKLVEARHKNLISHGLIDEKLLDGDIKDMLSMRCDMQKKLEKARLQEAAHKAVFGTKSDVLPKKKKKKPPKHNPMYR